MFAHKFILAFINYFYFDVYQVKPGIHQVIIFPCFWDGAVGFYWVNGVDGGVLLTAPVPVKPPKK
jgi:hypothetical protein